MGVTFEEEYIFQHVAFVDDFEHVHLPPLYPSDKKLVLDQSLARFQFVGP